MNPTPLPEEIEAGQKAYQRILAFQRYSANWTPLNFVFCVFFVGLGTYSSIQHGNYWPAAVFAGLVLISIIQYQNQKRQRELDLAYLALLKRVYGESVYEEIRKAPRSAYYYIFQKRYWPDRRAVSVALP